MEVKLFFWGNIHLYSSWNTKIVLSKPTKTDYDSELESPAAQGANINQIGKNLGGRSS